MGLDPDLKIAVKIVSHKFITSMYDILKLLCDVSSRISRYHKNTVETQLHSVCLVSFKSIWSRFD